MRLWRHRALVNPSARSGFHSPTFLPSCLLPAGHLLLAGQTLLSNESSLRISSSFSSFCSSLAFSASLLFSSSSSFSRSFSTSSASSLGSGYANVAFDFSTESSQDTIYQLSSGSNTAGVAMIRISGPHAVSAALVLTKRAKAPATRLAQLCRVFHPVTGELLDTQALLLVFRAPASFTGEDVVELHVHGNAVIVKGILLALSSLPASMLLRSANAGEFTRRAFEHGKYDLTQVEGLADLLNAETEMQRRQAVKQLHGDLRGLYERWKTELAHCLAHCEAIIDFGEDEHDVGQASILGHVVPRVTALLQETERHLSDGKRGELIRHGLQIAILGAPNVGKSSLLNLLVKKDAAIVSPVSGTTRDVVEVHLNLDGYPVTLADTAGIRETADLIEEEGVRRSFKRWRAADMKLIVLDICQFNNDKHKDGTSSMLYRQLKELVRGNEIDEDALSGVLGDQNTIIVLNKCDVLLSAAVPLTVQDVISRAVGPSHQVALNMKKNAFVFSVVPTLATSPASIPVVMPPFPQHICAVSCLANTGVDELLSLLSTLVARRMTNHDDNDGDGGGRSPPLLTRHRHRMLIQEATDHLHSFTASYEGDLVLAAEELRLALRCLGRITGHVEVDQLLDVIFRDFCIGK